MSPVRGPWTGRDVATRRSGRGIINLQDVGWVSQASPGQQLLGVQKRALRSALSALGWSGPVSCSVHRIRAQDLAWKAGFNFWHECAHQEEKNPNSPAYSIYLCTSSLVLQTAFSCFRNSRSLWIPFHFTWSSNPLWPSSSFCNAKQCLVTACFTSLSIFHLTLLFLCSSLHALTCCSLPPGVLLCLLNALFCSFLELP